MDDYRAVVIDTNFLGGRHFSSRKLRALASRLSARGHVVVIPEVVVLEWASHACEDVTAARLALDKVRRTLDDTLSIELPSVDPPPANVLAEAIREVIAGIDGVDLYDIAGEDAVQAVRDQVMQTGAASKSKDGTKTGAADALVLRVLGKCAEEYDQVVLASGDAHLRRASADIPGDVVAVKDQRELWRWHGLAQPASDLLRASIAEFIESYLGEALAGVNDLKLFGVGTSVDASVFEYGDFTTDDVRQTDVDIEGIRRVEMTDLEVVSGEEVPRLVVAQLEVIAAISVTNWFIGGNDGELLDEWTWVDARIEVPVTVELNSEWVPTDFDVNNTAEVAVACE